MAARVAGSRRRLRFRHARRGSGLNDQSASARLQDRLRRDCYRLDGSARYLAHARTAAFSLGLRHATMYVETQGRALSSALRHARLHLDAERLDFPDIFPTGLSDHGLDVGLDA